MTLETANREQVGRALDLARDGLRPFVERELRRSQRGLGQVRDALAGTDYAEAEEPLSDIAAIVLVILRRWQEVFQPRLKRTIRGQVRSHVGEVGSIRNRWAHQEPFSDDDAIRAVDTIRRLLRDVRAKEAEQVERVLVELRARESANGAVAELVAPPPAPEPEPEPAPPPVPEPESRAASTDVPVHDDEEYQRVLARRIDSLYQQIAGKRAEREQLNGEARRLEAEQQRIAGEIAGVVVERENVDVAIQRLEDELRRVEDAIAPPAPPAVDEPDLDSVAEPEAPVAPPVSTNQASADLVHGILAEAGRPLHYREIYKRYERVRHLDPRPPRSRSGNPANALATRYRHDPRLANVGRGMYALRGARAVSASPPAAAPRKPRGRGRSRYTSARPAAYTLFGARHEVRTFRDVLLGVCVALHERSPAEFERVLELRGRVRPYFSRNPDDLHEAVQVARSGICVEVNLSASNIVERCEQVIELCGFDAREFGVETR